MTSCLHNYVGFQQCYNPTGVYEEAPGSGLYITSLPGISLESIDKTANAEQVTYLGLWEDVQKEAAARFKIDFVSAIQRCYSINSECDYEDMICENKEVLVNAWRYLLGNQLMLFRIYTTRLNRFTTVDFEQAKELRDFYQVEYEKSITQAAQLIDVTSCEPMCCEGNPAYVTYLP